MNILSVPTSLSADDLTIDFKRINKALPTIDVFFQEDIELKNVTLYGVNQALIAKNEYFFQQFLMTGDEFFLLSMQIMIIPITATVSSDMRSVSVTPVDPLFNGYFSLTVNVVDLVGNPTNYVEYFYLNITETDIQIISPRLGVSNKSVNNLTIRTTRNGVAENTECKIGIDNPAYNFNSLALKPFESPAVMKPIHTISDVFSKFGLSTQGEFYIVCKDQSLGRVNQKKFSVYVDTIPPVITSFGFDPPKVVEYPEYGEQISTTLSVGATEPVICRYSYQQDKNYTEMIPFDNFNINDFDAYVSENKQKYPLPTDEKAKYAFYVQCEDRAGWLSGKSSSQIEVDLSEGLGISVAFPPRYTTNKTIELIALSNKRAVCQIKGEDIAQYTQMIQLPDQKQHKYYLGTLKDGAYSYSIYCRSTSAGVVQDQTFTYTFTIDNTKPGPPNINGTLVTCYSDKFVFEPPLQLTAEDAESGISHFLVDIKRGTEALLNASEQPATVSSIEEDNKGDPFALLNKTDYTFDIKAVNNVGLESTPKQIKVQYDPKNERCFEKNPPDVFISENQSTGLTEVLFVCSDDTGCDNNRFYYGTAVSADNCSASTLLPGPPFITEIRDTSYVCYKASDIVGNNATGSKLIEVEMSASCNNLKKDGDETDIDCGGGCPTCELYESCVQDRDCSSNYCDGEMCEEPTCDDGVLNGPANKKESDVDCGGYCSDEGLKCEIDDDCKNNVDCSSGFCNPDSKTCAESTCYDGLKGPEEADVDCGGICFAEGLLCESGSDCDSDDDCVSGNCLAGSCKARVQLVAPKSTFPWGTLLMILGILMMIGGSGYLVYKKKIAAPPAHTAAKKPVAAADRRIEEEARERARRLELQRRKAAEEQRRKAAEMTSKKDDTAKKRREDIERKKREQRERLFGKFGGKTEMPEEEMPLERDIRTEEKKGWLNFDTFKSMFKPKPPESRLEKELDTPQKTPEAPKPNTIFDELGLIQGAKEGDIYKMLEEAVPKKDQKKAFEELDKMMSGKNTDVYNELRKYIKPTGKKIKKRKR
ncbi:MAG: hypothetical protein KKE20_02710 [Nanoarchaeota archaeon]|nr:hypothetical protein [Nanoarchaeota archaeon]